MGVYEGRGQLSKAMKNLMLRWQETRGQWDDQQTRNFEDKFLGPLEQDMRQAGGAMDHMATVLNMIRRDCQ